MNFDDFYKKEKTYFGKLQSDGMQSIIEKFSIEPCKVLDLGAGEGRNSLYLASIRIFSLCIRA